MLFNAGMPVQENHAIQVLSGTQGDLMKKVLLIALLSSLAIFAGCAAIFPGFSSGS
jgi:hypothetical protein